MLCLSAACDLVCTTSPPTEQAAALKMCCPLPLCWLLKPFRPGLLPACVLLPSPNRFPGSCLPDQFAETLQISPCGIRVGFPDHCRSRQCECSSERRRRSDCGAPDVSWLSLEPRGAPSNRRCGSRGRARREGG